MVVRTERPTNCLYHISYGGCCSKKKQKNGQVSSKFAAVKNNQVSSKFAAVKNNQVSSKFAAVKNNQVSSKFAAVKKESS